MDDYMDKKTAINLLDNLIGMVEDTQENDYDTALKMGIEALKAHAQPVQRWIPCSERLPEDFEEVNVTCVNHDPEPYYDFTKDVPFTATAVCLKGKWYWYSSTCTDILAEYGNNHSDEMDSAIEVIAWMPLPEPYKDGEQNEND